MTNANTGVLRRVWLSLAAVGLAVAMAMAGTTSAEAAAERATPNKPDHAKCSTGRNIPLNHVSIQLWTFNSAINQHGIEHVLTELADMGYRNIEPFSYHGLSAQEFKDLADDLGLRIRSRHGSTNEANWDSHLADAKLFNQRWTGSGGFASPGINSYENVLATAETLNRLGERSVKNGTGKIFGHNHAVEFETQYVDVEGDGELKSAWQILVENTDPRWVTFQLDVGWADRAGEDSVALLEEFGDRIELLHVKDFVTDEDGNWVSWVPVGDGEIDWPAVFRAAQGNVKLYVVEQDFPADAFETAQRSIDYLDCLSF
ncbi:sugar phosphate isomerase/epimerase family protein [Egicoccus sp. AB-alg2]|uniref:sugar phosphate isomerase/epimerase family protein n=1 Tax=Egicoccus sp. AB-alg2 TaxID=3242693 RepID=UPI00359EE068